MDRQEYLSNISKDTRPQAKPKTSFVSSPFFKVILIGIGAFIIIGILSGIFGSLKSNEQTRSISLKLHIDNVITSINTYQPSVKSSTLRSYSASLSTVLSDTSQKLTTYLTEKYEFKDKDVDEKIQAEEDKLATALDAELFEGKINALLDRTYARKMAYEISVITNRESEIFKSTKYPELKSILSNSYESLSNLYDNFNNFSETK